MKDHSRIISIDGPAGSGKTTVSKSLAGVLGNSGCISSGLIYRMIAHDALYGKILASLGGSENALAQMMNMNGWSLLDTMEIVGKNDSKNITSDFYGEVCDKKSSEIAKDKKNRFLVSGFIKNLITCDGWCDYDYIIIEGRDIGSVVFPDAGWKVYLDASLEQRVERRNLEIRGAGDGILERDNKDKTRKNNPLVVPDGAFCIDSTLLEVREVVSLICNYVEKS